MSDKELRLQDEIRRGHQAKELLEHPLLKNALQDLEQDTITRLKESPVRDYDGQHELVMMLKIIGKFKADLNRHIQTGKLANTTLSDLAAKAKKILF